MRNKGVTLTEVMIVIVIMGIIASVTTISVTQVVENTEQAKVYADALAVSEAVTLYCADHVEACTPSGNRTWRTLRYSVLEEYLPDLDSDYYRLNTNIARVRADDFQNPQVRLRARDRSDWSWWRWRDPKDERYDKDDVTRR